MHLSRVAFTARFTTKRSFPFNKVNCLRNFSTTKPKWTEGTVKNFPWLLSKDQPRISKYPYEQAPREWSILNILPVSVQLSICQWLGTRVLQLNTGQDNFPDQFLVGASLAARRTVSLLSDQLSNPDENKLEELSHIMGPDLLNRFLEAAPTDTEIDINLSQIYDVNLGNIWITLGNPAAFSDNEEQEKQYEILRWMTVQIGLQKSIVNDDEEAFHEYKERISKSIMEGVQVGVDVMIDADITFKMNDKIEKEDIKLYDEGRRIIMMRFATPYFSPASKMVSGRDKETGEPVNDWNWRLVDIDQLIEHESMTASDE